MNVDIILDTMNSHQVAYILIGGMNFLLRHGPVLTYDVDFWIEDTQGNRQACEKALAALNAEWGASDLVWGPVIRKQSGWLSSQILFCLTSPYGAIDIFRGVKGLASWRTSFAASQLEKTAGGIPYHSLSDADMLQSQLALDANDQKQDRIAVLKKVLQENRSKDSNCG